MSKNQDETLPSVDSVLNKLKSDGAFDQFRKTCLGHIQGEPSFRAYSEHLEVVSRRYLQNYKWKDSSTKNEVRGRLRDHALGVIVSPDIQVGTPLIDIVEKVLESKAKELLPKISQAVDYLCETRAKQLKEAQLKKEAMPMPILSPNPLTDTPKPEFDLSLPIDIPGLNTARSQPSKKETHGTSSGMKKEGQVKAKPKGTAGVSKDPKAGNKTKPAPGGKTNTCGSVKAKSDSKEHQKQATEKEVVAKEKEKPKFRIPKKSRENVDKQEKEKEPPPEATTMEEPKPSTSLPNKDAKSLIEELKPSVRRRSARIASQTDSKASSENDDKGSESETEIHSRKRPKTSNQVSKKRPKVVTNSSSDEFESEEEGSLNEYESDTDRLSGGENLAVTEEPKKKSSKKSDAKGSSRRKSNHPTHKFRASKSPPVVVTRYNRSVKPNRRYYDDSAEIEEDSQSTVEENDGAEQQDEEITETKRTLMVVTRRPCDTGEMEVREDALVIEGEEAEVVYEMLTPKPPPLKVRKASVKGFRSRKKTRTRINHFCHR